MKHRSRMYDYFFGTPAPSEMLKVIEYKNLAQRYNDTLDTINLNTGPSNLLGIVTGGDFDHKVCPRYGLHNPDLLHKSGRKKTFPSNCEKSSTGYRRGDFFCSNMVPADNDKVFLPCSTTENGTTTQLSDHAIMEISLTVIRRFKTCVL